MVRDNGQHVNKALSVYDAAFRDLVANQTPKTFRDFLLERALHVPGAGGEAGRHLPHRQLLALPLPDGRAPHVDAEELSAIFQDFSSGFGEKNQGEGSLIKKPVVIDTTAA